MRVVVRRHLSASKLLSQIPRRFRERFPPHEPRTELKYALLLFPEDRADVIVSSAVRRALKDLVITEPEQLVAVGRNFTSEALQLLESAAAIVLRTSEFQWTDDSYKSITGAV